MEFAIWYFSQHAQILFDHGGAGMDRFVFFSQTNGLAFGSNLRYCWSIFAGLVDDIGNSGALCWLVFHLLKSQSLDGGASKAACGEFRSALFGDVEKIGLVLVVASGCMIWFHLKQLDTHTSYIMWEACKTAWVKYGRGPQRVRVLSHAALKIWFPNVMFGMCVTWKISGVLGCSWGPNSSFQWQREGVECSGEQI